jgi:hypothetical protein
MSRFRARQPRVRKPDSGYPRSVRSRLEKRSARASDPNIQEITVMSVRASGHQQTSQSGGRERTVLSIVRGGDVGNQEMFAFLR